MQNTVNNEGSFTESIFLMPKVYRDIFKETGDEFTKLKGFKDKVEFNQFKELLSNNNEKILTHHKWQRDMLNSEIKIINSTYLFKFLYL
jgi:hypothetical protein